MKEEMKARLPDPDCGGQPYCVLCMLEPWLVKSDGSATEAALFIEWVELTRQHVSFQMLVALCDQYYTTRLYKFMSDDPVDLSKKKWARQTIAHHFQFHDLRPRSILQNQLLMLTQLEHVLKNNVIVFDTVTNTYRADVKAVRELRETSRDRAKAAMQLEYITRSGARAPGAVSSGSHPGKTANKPY